MQDSIRQSRKKYIHYIQSLSSSNLTTPLYVRPVLLFTMQCGVQFCILSTCGYRCEDLRKTPLGLHAILLEILLQKFPKACVNLAEIRCFFTSADFIQKGCQHDEREGASPYQ
jgi:hypothetical protein